MIGALVPKEFTLYPTLSTLLIYSLMHLMNRIVDCTSLMNYAFIDFITTIILISLIFTTFLSLFPLASHPTLLSFTGYLTLLHPGTFYSSLV